MLDEQAVHQLVDHAGVAGEDAGEVGAGGAQPHVQFERRAVEAEQFPEGRFAAERIADAAEVDERGIGLGRLRRSRRAVAARSRRGNGGSGACERKRIFSVARAIRFS